MGESTSAPAVELLGVTKHFGAITANRDLSISVASGTIHGILGENGAGKSTAMKMVYGLLRPDSGEIRCHGVTRHFHSPLDAMKAGIGMVHQHFLLATALSALDNIILGNEPLLGHFIPRMFRAIDHQAARAKVTELMQRYGLTVPLDQPAGSLSVGEQQRIEILRLLYRDARIMILDEPTAVLTPPEVEQIFVQLRKLASEGRTILIVTHKLRELLAVTDAITIMRAGHTVTTISTKNASIDELATLMVGRRIELVSNNRPAALVGAPLLKLSHLKLAPAFRKSGQHTRFHLEIYPGEILGIAGVEGNGQSELIHAILAPRRYRGPKGEPAIIQYDGRDISSYHTRQVMDAGIAIIPGDRHHQGLLLESDVTRNLMLRWQRDKTHRRGPLLLWNKLQGSAHKLLSDWCVTPLNPNHLLANFSGGNQQKILVGREMATNPKLLIAVHPTRGVDIGAVQLIHSRILALRDQGAAILLISSDLDEIRALACRIAVLENFKIVRTAPKKEWDETSLGLAMSGAEQGAGS